MRFLIALLTLLLAGCGGDQPDTTVRLYGVVKIWPSPSGPCRRDVPCSTRIGGVRLVFWRRGHERVQATTNERGRYEVKVEPGTYRIAAPSHPRPARLSQIRVNVVTDTQLHLVIDGGAR